ncbi:MAG: prepilin-type N-terminal cleavage/methylation domain-containing protein [Planctomycetota bacterium]|nr:prepilin-type N-terminal cleavage/methylation domain-containing protein [Planctomycetota bacterium]
MTPARRAQGRGFTLIEAVLAMALLAGVMMACLGLRGQALAQQERARARHALLREGEAIFEMFTSGLLGRPEVTQGETLERRWKGEHLGKPYVLVGRRVVRENPAASALPESVVKLSDRVLVWRYELEYRGSKLEFIWPR